MIERKSPCEYETREVSGRVWEDRVGLVVDVSAAEGPRFAVIVVVEYRRWYQWGVPGRVAGVSPMLLRPTFPAALPPMAALASASTKNPLGSTAVGVPDRRASSKGAEEARNPEGLLARGPGPSSSRETEPDRRTRPSRPEVTLTESRAHVNVKLSWLNTGQIYRTIDAFGPLQPALVDIRQHQPHSRTQRSQRRTYRLAVVDSVTLDDDIWIID